MKKCPYCAEEIQDEAVKCKHCGEFLDPKLREYIATEKTGDKLPWYFRGPTIIMSVLTIGPFALPLVWFHPKYSMTKKIVITALVAVVSYWLSVVTMKAWESLMHYYNMFGGG